MKKRILFYSSVGSLELFKTQKFYQIDIALLGDLGYDVSLSNRILDSLLFWKYDILFSYFYRYSFFAALFAKCLGKKTYFTGGIDSLDADYVSTRIYKYLQPIITQYFIDNKSEIWLLFLIAHSKR